MRKILALSIGIFLIGTLGFVIYGCGKMETQQSPVGSIAPSTDSSKGGSLYDKYKDKFPENLMELTADDLVAKLVPHVIQSADGTTEEVYATYDVAEEVVKEVEESYPKYEPEQHANDVAKEFIEQNSALQSIIMAGSEEVDTSKIDITEEEFSGMLLASLEAKEKRIAAEKSYMIFSELAEPEVQNKIKASVAKIQASIDEAAEVGQYANEYFGKGPNRAQVRLLALHPWYWTPTIVASSFALIQTNAYFGDYRKNDNKKGNSFQHSYWNTMLARQVGDAVWSGKRDALWWAEAFSNAHEETPGNPADSKSMDLHNNGVGRRLYDKNSWDVPQYIEVRIDNWTIAKIHYRTLAGSAHASTFRNILYNRARNEAQMVSWNGRGFIPSPGVDQLVYLWK